jgi:hypothetical protein
VSAAVIGARFVGYLAEGAASVPPAGPSRMGTQPLVITPLISVEAWLRVDLTIKGAVVH